MLSSSADVHASIGYRRTYLEAMFTLQCVDMFSNDRDIADFACDKLACTVSEYRMLEEAVI